MVIYSPFIKGYGIGVFPLLFFLIISLRWIFLLLIVAVLPTMSVQEHAGNEKSCVWHARDFADGELKDELFCIRFPSIESELCLFFWS